MLHARTLFTDIFRAWGFASGVDYVKTISGWKALTASVSPIALKVGFMGAGVALGFWADWIWNPPGASFLLLGMNVVNARYGYLVAKRVKHERFSRIKFQKTFSISVSDLLALAMLHWAIKYFPYYETGRDILFGYLFGYKATGIFNHWAILKLQSGDLVNHFRQWLVNVLQSRAGVEVVDSIQQQSPAVPATPSSDEPTPPTPAESH